MRLLRRPAPAAPGRAALALAALAALPLGGCELLGQIEGFLSQPTQQELDGTEAILAAETGCASVQVRALAGSRSESLSTSDCRLTDGSYVDFWVIKTSSATSLRLALSSGDFAPYLGLVPVDLAAGTALANDGVADPNADGDGEAALSSSVSAGLYVVLANSADADERGDYTLRVERTAP